MHFVHLLLAMQAAKPRDYYPLVGIGITMQQEHSYIPVSRISGLCNDCIRTVTDIRILQHAGLTADGLRGIRLVIYIGVLANQAGWDINKQYMVPIAFTCRC